MPRRSLWLLVPLVLVLTVASFAGVIACQSVAPRFKDAETVPGSKKPTNPADAFTSMDIGFSSSEQHLDEIAKFVPGTSPIIRVLLSWYEIQDTRGATPDFSRLDAKIQAIRARGWRVMLVLGYAPPWSSTHDATHDIVDHDPQTWFPNDDDDWASIVHQTVQRYAPDVQAYEVWNEPNRLWFAKYGNNSTEDRRNRYWQLVKIAHERIHAVCATCVVIGGPSTAPYDGHPEDAPAAWLEWGYQNGYGKYLDAVAFHPFPQADPVRPACERPWENLFGPLDDTRPCGGLASIRAVMVKHGDAAKKIWATEWGFSFPPSHDRTLSDVTNGMAESVRLWRGLPYAGPLFLYTIVDPHCPPGPCWGLVTRKKVPKEPQYTLLSRALRFYRPECSGSFTQPPHPPSPVLEPGQCWLASWSQDRLVSANGQVRLTFAADGQLVLSVGGTELWSTGSVRGTFLANQIDGNLVLYDQSGTAVWSSGSGSNGPSRLQVLDDGNLVLTRLDGRRTWATTTLQNGQLVRNEHGGVAVHAGGSLIWFANPEELVQLGYGTSSQIRVPDAWAKLQPTTPRNGTLVHDETGRVAVIAGGAPFWFASPEELARAHPGSAGLAVPGRWITALPSAAQDGTLVRAAGQSETWRITGGRRTRVTPSEGDAVTIVGASALGLIPPG